MNDSALTRREMILGGACMAVSGAFARTAAAKPDEDVVLDLWQRETDLATAELYGRYRRDGDTRSLASLEKLEAAFEKVLREAKETVVVGDRPAVWSVYNMGYVVKTRQALFSIDLVHRRAAEFAPLLDFELVTHNHLDHFSPELYAAMNGAGKTVVSNFLDNYGVSGWKERGGYIRGAKTFKLKDVEVRTSLTDHNDYLVDFTTAFEIRIGDFLLYHTGDSGVGSEPKLVNSWGKPDLWLFFPGCGIDVARAVEKVRPKRVVFGHLWELGHNKWRLTSPLVRKALAAARPRCQDVSFALWGDRIC